MSLAGGAAGLVLGVWAARWLVASIVPVVPFGSFALDVEPGARVIVAALAFCALATLLFALGPSFELVRSAVLDDLKDATVSARPRRPGRGRRLMPKNTLVVAQIALSLALDHRRRPVRAERAAGELVPARFAVDGRLLVELDASLASLDEARATDLYRRVLERLRGEPGVVSAALASNVPFSSISEGEAVRLSGAAEDAAVDAEHYVVTAGYFETMGLAICAAATSPRPRPGMSLSTPRRSARSSSSTTAGAPASPGRRRDRPEARGLDPARGRQGEDGRDRRHRARRAPRSVRPRGRGRLVYLPFGGNYRAHMIVHLNVASADEDAVAAALGPPAARSGPSMRGSRSCR